MKEKGFPKPPLFVWKGNPTLWAYWGCWDQLFVSNGLLVRSLNNYKHFPRNAVAIPAALVPKVLEGLHTSPAGGHMGITRTIHRATITAKSSWYTHALLRFSGSFPFSVSATGVEAPSPRQTMLSR